MGRKWNFFLLEKLKLFGTKISKDTEFTVELNPGAWKKEEVLSLVELGVNRFSVGVQSLNEQILKKLDRVHSIDDVYKTLELLRFTRN